jgi:3-phenylpropionate/cinnamic acid dioxygenase small subunit
MEIAHADTVMSTMEAIDPALATWFEVSQFLYREATLLDARDWTGWGNLFTRDGRYWMPAARDQSDAVTQVSLINDNTLLREIRLARLKESDAPSLQAIPNSSHLVSNIMVTAEDASKGRYTVCSRFAVAHYTSWGTRTFQGGYIHKLERHEGALRIALKRVDLVDVEGPLGDIVTII